MVANDWGIRPSGTVTSGSTRDGHRTPNRNSFGYKLGRVVSFLATAWTALVFSFVIGRWAWNCSTLVMQWLGMR